jgi:hypothetical protein
VDDQRLAANSSTWWNQVLGNIVGRPAVLLSEKMMSLELFGMSFNMCGITEHYVLQKRT